jgi:hypothetical protein
MKPAIAFALSAAFFVSSVGAPPLRAQGADSNAETIDAASVEITPLAGRILVNRGEAFAAIDEAVVLAAGDRIALLDGASARLSVSDGCNETLTGRQIIDSIGNLACAGGAGDAASDGTATNVLGESAEPQSEELDAVLRAAFVFDQSIFFYPTVNFSPTEESFATLRPIGP